MNLEIVPQPEPRCPMCKSRLDIVVGGSIIETIVPPVWVVGTPFLSRERFVPFAACTGCEFCAEIFV